MSDHEPYLDFCKNITIKAQDFDGGRLRHDTTRLHTACEYPDVALVKMMVENQVPIRAREWDGQTPLHVAARWRTGPVQPHSSNARVEIMRILLDAKADINAKDKYGDTPLSLAVAMGFSSTARFLLANKANPDTYGKKGDKLPPYLVSFLTASDETEASESFLKAVPGLLDKHSLIERAAWLGSPRTVLALLERGHQRGGDPNSRGIAGCTALFWAAELLKYPQGAEATLALIDAGANVHAKSSAGDTPLSYAAAAGSPDAVLLLLKNGADPNITGAYNLVPLHYAVELLASPGGDQAVTALIDAGAKLDMQNKWGKTPLARAAALGSPAAVMLLLNAGAEPGSALFFASQLIGHRGGKEVIKALVEKGAEINAIDTGGRTPLDHALTEGSLAAAQALLFNGANVRRSNSSL